MTPIERFQALLDGKKICNPTLSAKFYQLSDKEDKTGPSCLLDDDGVDCDCDLHFLIDPDEEWKLYEEPKPEIQLTPEDIGKRVRLRMEELEKNATPGPWREWRNTIENGNNIPICEYRYLLTQDAKFIASSREFVPWAIAQIRMLEAVARTARYDADAGNFIHAEATMKALEELEAELCEEPKPEIKLTPEDVGRRVRLRNGRIELLATYDPNEKDGRRFETSSYYYHENGQETLHDLSHVDLVEVYR